MNDLCPSCGWGLIVKDDACAFCGVLVSADQRIDQDKVRSALYLAHLEQQAANSR